MNSNEDSLLNFVLFLTERIIGLGVLLYFDLFCCFGIFALTV